jgi:hypothetical protein
MHQPHPHCPVSISLFDEQAGAQGARKLAIALQNRAQFATIQDWRAVRSIEFQRTDFAPVSVQSFISDSLDPLLAIPQEEMFDPLQTGDLIEVWLEQRWQPALYVCPLNQWKFSDQAETVERSHLTHLHGCRDCPQEIAASDLRLIEIQHHDLD